MMQNTPVNIGSRRELFVDNFLVDRLDNARLILQRPREIPGSQGPSGAYATVIRDGGRYRAYYRAVRVDYEGGRHDGHAGEITCYEESTDGINWVKPELGLIEIDGSRANNVILAESPFCHNFSPFVDTRPDVPEDERYKALAGLHSSGLFAFVSVDGSRWRKWRDQPVINYPEFAFDSQNVAFWSEAEGCYAAYFRTGSTPHGRLRTISRTTSEDFAHWREPVTLAPNELGEHLYTNQTHPYFRASHIYVATPTRFMHGQIRGERLHDEAGNVPNIGSTDIMFMTMRAGANAYQRTFGDAWIRPGPNPARWGNRANYMALNIVPTGSAEMSLYHRSGARYVLRTDGFASVNAPWSGGELLTQPLVFSSRELVVNYSTSIAGRIVVEIQDADGAPIPGYTLDDCPEIIGDEIEHVVAWKQGADVSRLAGRPVRLRFALKDADLFALQFREENHE